MEEHVSSSTSPQMNRAPEYLRKELKSNRKRRTRGYDKLHLKSVKTEWGSKSFGFQAAQDWNNEDILLLKKFCFLVLMLMCFMYRQDSQGDQSL